MTKKKSEKTEEKKVSEETVAEETETENTEEQALRCLQREEARYKPLKLHRHRLKAFRLPFFYGNCRTRRQVAYTYPSVPKAHLQEP